MKCFLFISFIFFLSCKEKQINQIKEIVIIENRGIKKFSLISKKYEVSFTNGEKKLIDLNLYDSQIDRTIINYYDNKIDALDRNINLEYLNDDVIIMPAQETIYIIYFKDGTSQNIHLRKISETSPLDLPENKKIKKFITPLNELLDSIKRSNDLPNSDFLHL